MEILKVRLSEDEAKELIKKIIEKTDIDDRIESGIQREFAFKEMMIYFSIRFYTEWTEVELPDLSVPKLRTVSFSWMMINEEGSKVEVESEVNIDEKIIKEFEV